MKRAGEIIFNTTTHEVSICRSVNPVVLHGSLPVAVAVVDFERNTYATVGGSTLIDAFLKGATLQHGADVIKRVVGAELNAARQSWD